MIHESELLLSIAVVVVVVVGPPILYALGLSWSRGYHKGKKEFVDRLVNESFKKED